MKVIFRRLRELFRYAQAYKIAVYMTSFLTLVIYVLGMFFLIPNADSTSIQSGLTIITGILGVLLGAIIVILIFSLEQGQQGEELLRNLYYKYRKIIESNFEHVNAGYRQLFKLVRKDEIKLNDPIFIGPSGIPSKTRYCDVIGSLSGLTVFIRPTLLDELEKDLNNLGFSRDKINSYLYGKGALADLDTFYLFELIEVGLDLSCLAPWCSNEVSDLALDIFHKFSNDGVDKALFRLKRTRKILNGKILFIALTIITLTIISSVLIIFSITPITAIKPIYSWLINITITCFILSVLLTLFFVKNLFK